MKMNLVLIIFFQLAIISCVQNKKEETKNMKIKGEISDSYSPEKIEKYKQKIISEGDEYSYGRLMEYYENEEDYDSLLKYSYVMANKHNYPGAHSSIAWGIMFKELKTDDFGLVGELPIDQRNIVIEHLKKGADLENIDCMVALLSYYEKIGDSEKANEIDKRLEEISPTHRALKGK